MLWIKLLWNKIQVLISAPWKWHWLLKTTAHFLLLLLSFSLSPSRGSITCSLIMWHASVFISGLWHTLQQWHLGSLSIIIASISATTLLLLCSQGTHQLCVHAAHRGCESSTVTDTTQGDFTTHSTKGWILDHTVLRNWEKKKINAITARRMTSVTSVDPVESRL